MSAFRFLPFLFLASPEVTAAPLQWVEADCVSPLEIVGPDLGDTFGWLALGAGDVTGDGIGDIVSTAPLSDMSSNAAGFVRVYSGADGSVVWTRTGAAPSTVLGYAMQVDDWNDDGVLDVYAGAPFSGATGGHVWVFSGDTGATLHQYNPNDLPGESVGSSIALGGDWDGDGTNDVAIGAISYDPPGGVNSGRIYIFSGATHAVIDTIDGPNIAGGDANLGTGLSFLGDISVPPDGRDELVAGHRDPSFFGGSALVYGSDGVQPVLRYSVTPVGMPWGLFGNHIDGGRDLTGDGIGDFFVGDLPGHEARVFSGVDGSLVYALTGNGGVGNFGSGEMIPDIDGDGVDDLLFGARRDSTGGPEAGMALIYSGATGTVLRTMTHTETNHRIGLSARCMGDYDGDGAVDFLLAGTGGGTSGAPRGRLFVVKGLSAFDTFCASSSNSTGSPTLIHGAGSASVLANDLVLLASPVPAGSPGLFYYGSGTMRAPFGNGFRCVAGPPITRLPLEFATGEVLGHSLDNQAGASASQLVPGTTWHFQGWFRDSAAGGAGFDLSNGLSVVFQP